jgi:diguanylate cyclase (GGDEF)-like protein
MRTFIRKLGLVGSVLLISLISVVFSVAATYLSSFIFEDLGIGMNLQAGLIISMVISLIITPLMSSIMVKSYLEVDRLEEEMRILASYDTLTGLLSRREFHDRVNYFHKIAQRDSLSYSLIIADLDNFKEINDQFGHQMGDQTLEALGAAINETLRDSDLACRYGGDEFTFFLPNTDTKQAIVFCERLQEIIKEAISSSSLNIELSASIGIASYPENNAEFLEDLLARADNALYKVKRAGGNNSRSFDTSTQVR